MDGGSIITWVLIVLGVVSSTALLVAVGRAAKKWFPADESHGETDEAIEIYGELVTVIEECPEYDVDVEPGRVRFDGTAWSAVSTDGKIKKGAQAKILYRKNMLFFVEPVLALEEGNEDSVPALVDESASVRDARGDDET